MYEPVRKQKDILDKLSSIDQNVDVKWDERTGIPLRLKGLLVKAEQKDPGRAAIEFMKANKDLYLLNSVSKEMLVKRIDTDRIGARHVRMQQMYKELPVFGSEIIVHIDAEDNIKGTTGKLIPEPDLPDKAKISEEEAMKIVLGDNRNNTKGKLHAEPTLMVLSQFIEKPHLCMACDGLTEPTRILPGMTRLA